MNRVRSGFERPLEREHLYANLRYFEELRSCPVLTRMYQNVPFDVCSGRRCIYKMFSSLLKRGAYGVRFHQIKRFCFQKFLFSPDFGSFPRVQNLESGSKS